LALAKDFGDVNLDGKKWKDLGKDERQRFWDYILPVEMLSSVEGTLVNEVFDRFNRNSKKLERQELRHAKYDGWFITFAEDETERAEWQTFKIVTKARSKRMRDVQFMSELMLIILENGIAGFDQDNLDSKYSQYDEPDVVDEETEDVLPAFSKVEFTQRWESVRSYVLEMETTNACVSIHASTFMNFYTLWGVVGLTAHMPAATEVAEKYKHFMEDVKTSSNLATEGSESADDPDNLVSQYQSGMQGASTDLSKRQVRHNALLEALLK
jgi:hypothetical protein